MLTVGSLFSGVGGMDLGLERAGMRVVWQAEIDDFASRVLRKHWPDVPNYGDVTGVDWEAVERPDVLAGGFMCTDLSSAGLMAGLDGDTRSGITWRELVRATVSLRPRYLLVENVPMLLSGDGGRWFGTVLGQLAALGYDAEWDCIPAAAVGAPHRRYRVFLVAHPHDSRLAVGQALRCAPCARKDDGAKPGGLAPPHVADAQCGRLQGGVLGCRDAGPIFPSSFGRSGRGHHLGRSWDIEPSMGRLADGIPRRLVERSLRGLGNAVVPQVAELVGSWIVQHDQVQREEQR